MSTITEHPNAALVRRVYAAISVKDTAELAQLISPDITVLTPGRNPLAGRYEGRDALFGFFGQLAALSGGTYAAELSELYTGADSVVAVHHGTGTRDGKMLDAHAALVFELSGGLVTAVTVHQQDQDGWDDFFS